MSKEKFATSRTHSVRGDARLVAQIDAGKLRDMTTTLDWLQRCFLCGAKPVISEIGLCAHCTFGEGPKAA